MRGVGRGAVDKTSVLNLPFSETNNGIMFKHWCGKVMRELLEPKSAKKLLQQISNFLLFRMVQFRRGVLGPQVF